MRRPGKVLVVDDEALVRDSLTDYLEDEGFEVRGAESAEQALAMLATEPYDVAVVDVRLPKMDGNAMIVKAHALHPHVKFMVLTGSVHYVLPGELQAIGLTRKSVLRKPVASLKLISDAILTVLSREGADGQG